MKPLMFAFALIVAIIIAVLFGIGLIYVSIDGGSWL